MHFWQYDQNEKFGEWCFESSHMCKNSSRRTPRPKNLKMWYSDVKNTFSDHIIKMKNVRNGAIKAVPGVRYHPKELLVPKI